jgi:hypothetical protein
MADVSLRLLVLKSPQGERLRAFYRALGIDWAKEKHGDSPLRNSGWAAGWCQNTMYTE